MDIDGMIAAALGFPKGSIHCGREDSISSRAPVLR